MLFSLSARADWLSPGSRDPLRRALIGRTARTRPRSSNPKITPRKTGPLRARSAFQGHDVPLVGSYLSICPADTPPPGPPNERKSHFLPSFVACFSSLTHGVSSVLLPFFLSSSPLFSKSCTDSSSSSSSSNSVGVSKQDQSRERELEQNVRPFRQQQCCFRCCCLPACPSACLACPESLENDKEELCSTCWP